MALTITIRLVSLIVAVVIGAVNCDQLLLEQKYADTHLFAIGSCMVNCATGSLRMCFDRCSKVSVKDNHDLSVTGNASDFSIQLVCRDSVKVVLKVDSESRMGLINIVKVKNYGGNESTEIVLISDTPIVEVVNLKPNQTYHPTAIVLISSVKFALVYQQGSFETLPSDFIPEAVNETNVLSFHVNQQDNMLVDAVVAWKPTADKVCNYEVLHKSPTNSTHAQPNQFEVHQLGGPCRASLESLQFDTHYEVAVQAINAPLKSNYQWINFRTPSCFDIHNHSQLCAPEKISNISVEAVHLSDRDYQLNITWSQPTILPDSYEIHVYDRNPDKREHIPHSIALNASGNTSNIVVESFLVNNLQFEVVIVAHANNRTSSQNVISSVQTDHTNRNHWVDALVVVIVVSLAAIAKFMIDCLCKRCHRTKRHDKPRTWKTLELSGGDIEINMEQHQPQVVAGALAAPVNDGTETTPRISINDTPM